MEKTMTAQEHVDESVRLFHEAQALYDRQQDGQAKPEDLEQFDRLLAASDRHKELADKAVELQDMQARLAEPDPNAVVPTNAIIPTNDRSMEEVRASSEYAEAFWALQRGNPAPMQQFRNIITTDGANSTTSAGALIPEDFETRIVKQLFQANALRPLATVRTYRNDTNLPVNTSDGTAFWADEHADGTSAFDSDPTWQRITFGAHKMIRYASVTNETLQDEDTNMMEDLADSFGRSFGDLEESDMLITGAKTQAIAGNVGTPVESAGANVLAPGDLLTLEYNLPAPYESVPGVSWLMHKNIAEVIRKMRADGGGGAGTGEFLWSRSMIAGEPDRLNGYPIAFSKAMPSAVAPTGGTANLIFFGDFASGYRIADRLTRRMAMSEHAVGAFERDAIRFRMTQRVDGKVVLKETIRQLDIKAT